MHHLPTELDFVPGPPLPPDFYLTDDVVAAARLLLGKTLVATDPDGRLTAGRIVETEAYAGVTDRACHAFGNRRTPRTETMYRPGGVAYVYLCYGIHRLLNVVVSAEGNPQAVLIRALEPLAGVDLMLRRRAMPRLHPRITAGPGALTQALGVGLHHNGLSLLGPDLWIADNPDHTTVQPAQIVASPRVGVAYAGPDALLPYRFRIKGNPYTSPAK